MGRKERIDVLLAERGLAESRSAAQRLVMAGQVRMGDQIVHKPSQRVERGAQITIESGPRFVSRGGEKLAAGLERFGVVVEGLTCADVGASTGGFTDCLLQHGAARVYSIDVGNGLLHWRLRNHPRVVVMEGTNARTLKALPESIDLTTIDASFISLRLLLPSVVGWLADRGEVIALVKPQFEAGRKSVPRGGVVRDPEVHRQVLQQIIDFTAEVGLSPRGLMRSPLVGPKGNIEFMLWCGVGTRAATSQELLAGIFPA